MTPSSVSFSTSHFWRSPFGSATPDYELERQLAIHVAAFDDSHHGIRARNALHDARELGAGVVEERHFCADGGAHHVQQVVRFGAIERDSVGGDRRW